MTPTFGDACARRPVRLRDGRTGRLVYWPSSSRHHRSSGRKAKVRLPSGAIVGVWPDELTVIEEAS